MKKVNVNQLVHCASPFYMGLALHSWAVTGIAIDGDYSLGLVLGKPKTGLITADARIVADFGPNSLQLVVRAVRIDGTVVALASATLDSNSGTGVVDMLQGQAVVPLQSGDAIYMNANYNSGPGEPPLVSLVFQVG